ncbi:MAG: hypothetical protein L0221_05930, partial [Chloroflexi bacterium]|nr:hypothetical protein [Chloroflexota bacterium]
MLAVLVAAALVIGAVLIRRAIDDDSDDGGSNGGGGDGTLTIACAVELEAVCATLSAELDGLDVRVEDASSTVDTLASGTATELDGWLTFAPWPEVAELEAGGRDVLRDEETVGSTRLAIVVWNDRRAALEATACPDGVDWRCLGDASGRTYTELGAAEIPGTVKVGLPPPDSAIGLLVLGGAVTGYFGRTDVGT